MTKKVLIVHPSLGLGGAEKIIAFLANTLSCKFDVDLMLLKDADITLTLPDSVKVTKTPCYSDSPIFGPHLISGMIDLCKLRKKIMDAVVDTKPDILVCFDLRVLLAISLPRIIKGTKIMFSERADPYENPVYWKIILKHVYKKMDGLVFQTEGAKDFYGTDINRGSVIIHNPALMRVGDDIERHCNRKKVIFTAGRFQYRKGFDLLIKSFAKIADKYPDYKLIIYGSGEEESNLRELIRSLQMDEMIFLQPPRNGVVESNYDASLFVLPSRSEGIPNILIEAMYIGIPAVAADCSPGGARLLSENGKNCLLAKNDDADSLSVCLDYALAHPDEMLTYSDRAEKGLLRFDKETIGKQWIEYVEEVING